jgi:hypothetical protein
MVLLKMNYNPCNLQQQNIIINIQLVVFASAAFLNKHQQEQSASLSQSMLAVDEDAIQQCLEDDEISIYKYTIQSKSAQADAKFAQDMFGCAIRDVTDTHGCAEVGKTSCLSDTLGFNLHFVTNKATASGDLTIEYWDNYVNEVHGELEQFNKFMDFRVVFYTPRLDNLMTTLLTADTKFLLRSNYVESTDETWYSLIFTSPSSKTFEVTSTKLNLKSLSETVSGKKYLSKHNGEIMSWSDDKGTCPHTQIHSTLDASYTSAELDAWYEKLNDITVLKGGKSAGMLPIRNQIAVSNLDGLEKWYNKFFPSLKFSRTSGNTDKCQSASLVMPMYTDKTYMMETRFVQNDEVAGSGDKTVKDFITYVESVHADNVSPNHGWDVWYDRHLGFMMEKCSLDNYMIKFYRNDVAFNPHGRALTTENTGTPTQHCWTEGTEAYGIEMQGSFDFSFRDCYTVFDWCTTDTNGAKFCKDETATSSDSSDSDTSSSSSKKVQGKVTTKGTKKGSNK